MRAIASEVSKAKPAPPAEPLTITYETTRSQVAGRR
jgi:hypothetical protein